MATDNKIISLEIVLFYPKSFSVKIEERPVDSYVTKEPSLENKQTNLTANKNWVESKIKRRQRQNMGKLF